MNAHERAAALVYDVLCALCCVAALVAAAQAQPVWSVVFAGLAFVAYEASSGLG